MAAGKRIEGKIDLRDWGFGFDGPVEREVARGCTEAIRNAFADDPPNLSVGFNAFAKGTLALSLSLPLNGSDWVFYRFRLRDVLRGEVEMLDELDPDNAKFLEALAAVLRKEAAWIDKQAKRLRSAGGTS